MIPMRMDSIEAMKFISEKVRHRQLAWYRAAFAALHCLCISHRTATQPRELNLSWSILTGIGVTR